MKNLLNLCLGLLCINVAAQTTQLVIPDTLIGPSYTLNMHKDSVQFFPGNKSQTYAFNSFSYLGPTLIFNKGANVNITVNNQIGDTTTVHWHGIHLPSKWDGGPHTPILPSASWNPTFTVMDNAATYWYHPHLHMKTAEQAIKGAAGLIIVRDPIEAALNLPRKYGVDDFPLVIQCQQYDSANQAMPLGMQDSTILINGARANYGYTVYANCPAQIVRMRILNASGERTFNFGFTANKQFKIIASDGGLLNAPVNTTRLRLAPGERAEILLDLNGMNGQTIYLMSYASELPMGIQGGPTMPMPSGPPMDSPLNGIDFNIMQINVVPQTASPVTTIPATLTTNNPYPTGSANVTRTIRFTADSAMVMDGPFYFNDSTFNMMRIDYEIPLNNIEIWKLVNETMVAHPFHIHDVQFFLFDRNGSTPPAEELGRKDVVLVPPGDSVMFITKFEDFADTIIPFMYHCHILMHEDDGMMGQFIVKPNLTSVNEIALNDLSIKIYPNPVKDILFLNIEQLSNPKPVEVKVYNSIGKLVYQTDIKDTNTVIDIGQWSGGLYLIEIQQEGSRAFKKIIVE
ncbi:MAG: multicopper oxidase domain-containing protein [Bacteroidetes bacterium]|nr:multicopper oxidase domain-containing protein [Bacteroidota bacterium]